MTRVNPCHTLTPGQPTADERKSMKEWIKEDALAKAIIAWVSNKIGFAPFNKTSP
ncbi:hypothetical protein BDR04DRAFT_1091585 [Suillus decipiens]|nr:hypothetical protein BDR04DRAFT_1091585 [Suillus decipiens]